MTRSEFKIEWLATILRAEGVGELTPEEQKLLFRRIRELSPKEKAVPVGTP